MFTTTVTCLSKDWLISCYSMSKYQHASKYLERSYNTKECSQNIRLSLLAITLTPVVLQIKKNGLHHI